MSTPGANKEELPPGTVLAFTREHFALVNLGVVLALFVNLLIAIVTGSVHAYRLLPCWFLLLAVSAASSFLQNMKVVVWFATVAMCVGIEFLRYREYNAEIAIRTLISYAPLTAFMLILLANAMEETSGDKEHTEAMLQKLRGEANDLLNHLKKLRSGELEKAEADQEEQLVNRKACFEFYREIYPKILQLRYKRDIPPLVHLAAEQGFGLQAGILYEIPEDRQAEVHVRASWGIPKTAAAEEAVALHGKGELVRRASDDRSPYQLEQIKRQPNLYEEYDRFTEALFGIEALVPILVLGRTLYVLVIGMPSPRGRVEYEFGLLNPVVAACGQAMSKLAQKDGRKAVSTFTA